MSGARYELNVYEYFAKQLFWFGILTIFEGDLNPLNWTILNNFFTILIYIYFQLWLL